MASMYALCCGYLEFERRFFFPDAERGTQMTIPIPCYLIVHPHGKVLFDTGLHCDAAADPVGRLGERTAKYYRVRSAHDEHVLAQLALLGLKPGDITHVVNSHLHFDHCGCNAFFPTAQFLVQQQEWQQARSAPDSGGPRDWDHPLDYRLLGGERDLFGDGSVILLPTPGHTAGHQSLLVRTGPQQEFVLAGDACYTREHLARAILPPSAAVWNPQAMADSMAVLRRLSERSGVTLIYGHDSEQWRALPHAPHAMA